MKRGLGALWSCFYNACLCFIFHVLSRCTVKGYSVIARADVVVETDISTSDSVCWLIYDCGMETRRCPCSLVRDKCTRNTVHLIHVWSRSSCSHTVDMFECFLFSTVFSLWISEDCCAIFTTKSSKSASQQAGVTCRNSLGSYSSCKHTSACAATTGVSSLISLNKTQTLK